MPTFHRTVLLSRIAACVLMVGAAALPAMGQAVDLPPQLTEQPRLSEEDAQKIDVFVKRHEAQLAKASDANAVKTARMRLIEPLMNPKVSVDFRIRYSAALLPKLEPLLTDKSDLVASNAVQILGELATPGGVEKIVAVFTDARPTVRFSAAYAMQRTYENLMPPRGPGLTSEQVKRSIDALGERVTKEEDANVVQELVLALQAASEIPSAQLVDVRSHAVAVVSSKLGARAKGLDAKAQLASEWRVVLWRANRLTRTALTQAPPNEPKLSAEALKQAGGLAGHTLAFVLRRTQAGIAIPAERAMLVQATALAEATYYFAHSAIGKGDVIEAKLSQKLTANDDKGFATSVMDIIGPKGALTSPAFGFPPNEFVKP